MSLLHKIIKKELAKRYVEPDTKIGPLEKACTCDPEDGPFYLPIKSAPPLFRIAAKMRNFFHLDSSGKVEGALVFDDETKLHIEFVDRDSFCIYPLDPFSNTGEVSWQQRGNFEYLGRRDINGNVALAFQTGSDHISEGILKYLDSKGNVPFNFWLLYDEFHHDPKNTKEYIELFGETVLKVDFNKGFDNQTIELISYDSKKIFLPVNNDSFECITLDDKDYIFGKMIFNEHPRPEKRIFLNNLCDRDGNLYAGHGGPFYEIHEIGLSPLSIDGSGLIYAKKKKNSLYHFFDSDGKVVDAFGHESKSRNLCLVNKYGENWYGIGKNQGNDPFNTRIFAYDGTDMLCQFYDFEQLSGFLRTHLGDKGFDRAFEEYYLTVHKFDYLDRKKILGMLLEADDYAKENIDEGHRTRYLTYFMRLIQGRVFGFFDRKLDNFSFGYDLYELGRKRKEFNMKYYLNVAKACHNSGHYLTDPYTAVRSYTDQFSSITGKFTENMSWYMDYFWYHISSSPDTTIIEDDYYDIFALIADSDMAPGSKDMIENVIKVYSERLFSPPDNDNFLASHHMKGLFSYLKDELRYHPKRLEKYTSTISSERFDEIGFTQYIMLDSFGLLKKYEKISTNMKLIGLKKSDLRQAYDGISETMDMVLERSKRRHTNPRDDISDFLENVNMSILHAPDLSVEYMKVAA